MVIEGDIIFKLTKPYLQRDYRRAYKQNKYACFIISKSYNGLLNYHLYDIVQHLPYGMLFYKEI